eukprot:SAG22_NODE_650_length_8156_cov_10.637830_1_plen_233_part_00
MATRCARSAGKFHSRRRSAGVFRRCHFTCILAPCFSDSTQPYSLDQLSSLLSRCRRRLHRRPPVPEGPPARPATPPRPSVHPSCPNRGRTTTSSWGGRGRPGARRAAALPLPRPTGGRDRIAGPAAGQPLGWAAGQLLCKARLKVFGRPGVGGRPVTAAAAKAATELLAAAAPATRPLAELALAGQSTCGPPAEGRSTGAGSRPAGPAAVAGWCCVHGAVGSRCRGLMRLVH